ncbi:uncharacterized protein LOC129754554 [Uranotaenia lowii]|uniref:uncharacterized protein LOC129754554 n=1 Tax=Uranotaenia lowii TaxID=190385 RepID=UPI00247A79FA|nr:uncharacterized protein LOC129754554 [Uranotaenia lowii]
MLAFIFCCALLVGSSIAQSNEVKCYTCYDKGDCDSNKGSVQTCNEEQVTKNHNMLKVSNPDLQNVDPKGPYICYDYETKDVPVDPENQVSYYAGKGCTTVAVKDSFCKGWIEQLTVVRCRTCETDDGCSSMDVTTTTAGTTSSGTPSGGTSSAGTSPGGSSTTIKPTPTGTTTTAAPGSSSNRNSLGVVVLLFASVFLILVKVSL